MNEEDFIEEYGIKPTINIHYYVDDNGDIVIDEERILEELEEIKLTCDTQ
jgi:hypothetical protein